MKSSETRLWRSGPATADLSVYHSCHANLPSLSSTAFARVGQGQEVLSFNSCSRRSMCCRWEVDKECSACSLPWHLAAPHHPHSPLHRHLRLLGPRGRPGLQESTWRDAALLGCLYAAALAAAWGCWPPAFIRGNRAHAAARHSRQALSPAAVQSMLCEHTALTGLALLVPYGKCLSCPPCHVASTLLQSAQRADHCLPHAWSETDCLADVQAPFCAVFLGTFTLLAVRFHSLAPWAGFLLLPFLGFSVFGAALLSLSLRSGNAEVRCSIPLVPS